MKIIHVVWSLKYGGAETLLVQLLNRQCNFLDLKLIIVNDAIEENLVKQIDKRVSIHTIRRPLGSQNPFYILKLSRLLLFAKSDIVHFHQDNLIEYIPVRFFKKNLCLTVHSVAIDEKSLPKYDYLFAISRSVQEEIRKKCGLDSRLIYNGIDLSQFNKKGEGNFSTEKWNILQVGRLMHIPKGQHLLILAAYKLIQKYHFMNFTIHFWGEGPSEEYLQNMAEELSLKRFIKFEGSQSTDFIKENLYKFDLLVQPSLYEGFGLTSIEGMAAGIPVLVSNVNGLSEIIQQDQYGYSFEQNNAEDLADNLWKIINKSPEELKKITANAYQYVKDNFDIAVTSDNYLKAYHKITGL